MAIPNRYNTTPLYRLPGGRVRRNVFSRRNIFGEQAQLSIFAEYRKSLKLVEVEEILDLYLYRPLAFVLVKAIYRTNITPNQITVFSLFVGVLAGVAFGLGYRAAVIAGALLYALCIVLDCADGQLARLKKNGTRLGRILDGLIDYIVTLALYLGLGFGFASKAEHPVVMWLVLAATGASNVFHSITLDYYRSRFLEHVQGSVSRTEEDDALSFQKELDVLRTKKGKFFMKAAIKNYLRYLNFQKKMTLQREETASRKKFDREEFSGRNRAAMRGWTFLGSSTGGTLLIVSALIGRIDFFLWGLIVVGNIWAAVMFLIQNRVDKSLSKKTVS